MKESISSGCLIDNVVIDICAAILLRHNTHMNLVQRIISTLLYGGHALKQVCNFLIIFLSLVMMCC